MSGSFEAIKITDDLWWVGAIDWAIRDFHGYDTPRGSTYNAYLVRGGDKTVLLDTVRAPFRGEMMARIASVMNPGDIDIIVSNHSEPDHSGSLAETAREISPEEVFASKMGKKALSQYWGMDVTALDNGGEMDIGGITLKFMETRMIHWPDSMVTYIPERKCLISQDAFGMHLASGERFADELPEDILRRESDTYFANIVLPYAKVVQRVLDKIEEAGLDIEIICPDHGPVWRGDDVGKFLSWYREYTAQTPTMKAVIVYDTMWHSTEMMARSLADGLIAGGAAVKILKLGETGRARVITEIMKSGALVVGSPTLNNGIFPTLADALTYAKGLKPQNLIGAAFGSFGWSGEAVGILEDYLEEMDVEIVHEGMKVQYRPAEEDLAACREMGLSLAKSLKEFTEAG